MLDISILVKSKCYKKLQFSDLKTCSFTQATKGNIENIFKIKNAFPSLSFGTIIKIYNVTNNNKKKNKLKFNMITKKSFRKQVIIPMSKDNSSIIVS